MRSDSVALPQSPAHSDLSLWIRYALLCLIVVGICARILGARGDFWLDEIWALSFVRGVRGIDGMAHSTQWNGHLSLATFVMYLLRDTSNVFVHRSLSLLCGIGAIGVAWLVGRRKGIDVALIFSSLVAISYPFVMLGSEARGYSPMLLFVLVAWWALESRGWFASVVYNVAAVLAILFHLTAITAVISFAIYSGAQFRSKKLAGSRFLALHLFPLGVGGLVVWSIRGLVASSSGPLAPYIDIILSVPGETLGFPRLSAHAPWLGIASLFASLGFCIYLLGRLWQMWRTSEMESLLLGALIFVIPAAMVVTTQPRILMERYFILSMLGALYVVARGLAVVLSNGVRKKSLPVALFGICIAGHLVHTALFVHYGRGDLRTLLYRIVADNKRCPLAADDIFVVGSQEFRDQLMLSYFAHNDQALGRLRYLSTSMVSKTGPRFYLRSQDDPLESLPQRVDGQAQYELIATAPFAGFSGLGWGLYESQFCDGENYEATMGSR